ncbi:transposase [Streptomyces sp. NPDC090493]|uniref:transposase n=1 Tax=Streptomyces sp. NPDC090493 TaxID=3365964 RepID=UPI0038304041
MSWSPRPCALPWRSARQAPQELVGLVTEEWGTRYGRAARLGKNPTQPKTRIKNTGDDVYLLLRYVRTYLRTLWQGPQVQSLRQIFLQNFWIDERARVRWREPGDGEAGLPPSSMAIVSPYDLTTRYACRNDTRWKGFLAHVTETCDDDAVNIITDVTTTLATLYDIKALPAIHNRLAERNLLPGEHLVDGGYTSVVEQDQADREHGITLVGPVRKKRTRQSRKGNVFDRDAFTIDWDRQHAVCPQGKLSRQWATPPAITPYVQVRFSKEDCGQCSVKSGCTRSDRRTLTFLPQQLYERQAAARAAQQTTPWKANYAMRAGIESTVNEFVNGHGMRQARYRSRAKTHVQHVLTAIAVNIERVQQSTRRRRQNVSPEHPPRSRASWTGRASQGQPHGAQQGHPDVSGTPRKKPALRGTRREAVPSRDANCAMSCLAMSDQGCVGQHQHTFGTGELAT